MTPESLRRRLSANLKKARKACAFSQERLAEEASLSSQMVNDIEGCRRWPSEKTLAKLAAALHVDAYMLLLPEDFDFRLSAGQRKSVADDLQRLFAAAVQSYLSDDASF